MQLNTPDKTEERDSGMNDADVTCAHSPSSRNSPSSLFLSPTAPTLHLQKARTFPNFRQRLAELVLEHVPQVPDVELRGEEASSAGGRSAGGILGGLREAQPEGVSEALEVSLGVVDALPQRVESGHVKHSLGLLWVREMLMGDGSKRNYSIPICGEGCVSPPRGPRWPGRSNTQS